MKIIHNSQFTIHNYECPAKYVEAGGQESGDTPAGVLIVYTSFSRCV
jgi:hypothetical protein